MSDLTSTQKAEYIERNLLHCPACGFVDVEEEVAFNGVIWFFRCPRCKASFVEEFELVDVRVLRGTGNV
jgi:uncharacterized C2H2 Zn-finger protein